MAKSRVISKERLLFLERFFKEETHVRLQSYSPDMNDKEFRDYAESLQGLWIVQDLLGKPLDTTWMGSARVKPL